MQLIKSRGVFNNFPLNCFYWSADIFADLGLPIQKKTVVGAEINN